MGCPWCCTAVSVFVSFLLTYLAFTRDSALQFGRVSLRQVRPTTCERRRSTMRCKLVCLFVCVAGVAGTACGGEKPWIQVKSPHFRVLTDAGAGDGRMVAREFERLRAVFAARYPDFRLDSGAPLTIF